MAARRAASSAGSLDGPVPVRDHAAIGRARRIAVACLPEPGERRREPVLEQLERDGWFDDLDELVGGDDDDEPVCRRRDDLLARVGAASALDDPAVAGDLVGAVDGEIEAREGAQPRKRLDRQAHGLRRLLRGRGRCDTADPEAAGGERLDEEGGGGAGAETDGHAVLDECGRRLGRQAFLALDVRHE